jgi:TolA-binding protein
VEKRADLSRRATEKLVRALKASEPWRRPALAAAALVAVAGLSYAGGRIEGRQTRLAEASSARLAEAADGLRESREEFGRLGLEVKSIRTSLDGLKGERVRTDPIVRVSQLNDRVERLSGDTAAKITRMSEQLERIEKTQRDPGRLQALFERFDRLEKQVGAPISTAAAPAPLLSAAPTPPPKPLAMTGSADVTQTGSLADTAKATDKPAVDPRKAQLEGYILRDVEDGWALVETRYGRIVEVSAGQIIPGLGRVEAIEKRGRQWVVVTPKGFIGERFN